MGVIGKSVSNHGKRFRLLIDQKGDGGFGPDNNAEIATRRAGTRRTHGNQLFQDAPRIVGPPLSLWGTLGWTILSDGPMASPDGASFNLIAPVTPKGSIDPKRRSAAVVLRRPRSA